MDGGQTNGRSKLRRSTESGIQQPALDTKTEDDNNVAGGRNATKTQVLVLVCASCSHVKYSYALSAKTNITHLACFYPHLPSYHVSTSTPMSR